MKAKTGSYDFKEVEESVIDFWEKNDVYKKCRAKGEGKESFFFIQGPPYTSGQIHIGHAWNNSLKDVTLRYKRMKGFDVFDRAAYDQHGLPTARKVMANLKLERKEDIVKLGVEKFIRECIKFSRETAEMMNKDLWRIGVWMDYENACLPVNNSYIEGEWFLIKKAHEKGRLYEGLRTMSWCASCQTAMAKHECEYREVNEPSIFVKFPVEGKDDEYLIIWTTTPWTIAYNLAIMVHPELPYVKAKVGDEVWILSKALAAPVVQTFTDHKLEIIDELPGRDLEGLGYVHPWNSRWDHYKEIKAQHPKAHTVILSEEYVDTSAGTGLVHCAPGCGPEDYEVGYRNNIPAFNNLGEDGVFPEDMGEFAGLKAKKDDQKFIDAMEKDGVLVATTEVEHDYAHCERCHNPVVFRTTKQWFFRVEDLKERMVKENEHVYWVPETVKNAFKSWLENLRDNSITKQRFWGTPVPIWKCETCGRYEVIGSALELKEKAGHCPDNLHKPWIDEVEINCECGDMMKRLPDILDVWIDAGTLCWNILDYPQDKELYKKLFPADFILEAKEQVRGWFNLLVVASLLALDRHPFKAVYVHGMITVIEGKKMSKSLGNVISPYELIDKYGADTLRFYMTGTNAGEDINFSWDETKLKHRNLGVLWNVHRYLIELAELNGLRPTESPDVSSMGVVERFMFSRTASKVKAVSDYLEKYMLDDVAPEIEELFLEMSRTYIQFTRDKSSSGSKEEKQEVVDTIYHNLMSLIKIMAPVCPFITEKMYLNLKDAFGLEAESVHMYDWPEADESLIDTELEQKFDIVKTLIQGILSARERAQLGVRWPVGEVIVVTSADEAKAAVDGLGSIVMSHTNVKEMTVVDRFDKVRTTVKADFGKVGPEFGDKSPKVIAKLATQSPESILGRIEADGRFFLDVDGETLEITKDHLIVKRDVPDSHVEAEFRNGFIYLDKTRTPELDAEGYARELMRTVQSMRKDAGLVKSDRISLFIKASEEDAAMFRPWLDQIKERVGASQMNLTHNEPAKMHQHKKKAKVRDKEFIVEFDKV
ncbi:isoleucine--tRNA ligase [Candidatus Woesearchaeota archaeon]|nr:isoleucine--tRNA ligase [Candidatus Woesearchaeota archaeon]